MGRGGRQAGSLVGRFVARRGERGGGNNVKVRLGGRWWRHVFALSQHRPKNSSYYSHNVRGSGSPYTIEAHFGKYVQL